MGNLTFQGPFCIYFWEKIILIFPKHNQHFDREEGMASLAGKELHLSYRLSPDSVQ